MRMPQCFQIALLIDKSVPGHRLGEAIALVSLVTQSDDYSSTSHNQLVLSSRTISL